LLHDLKRPVTGAVVGEDDFQGLVGLGECAFHRLADVFLLIVGEQRKGDERALFCGLGHFASLIGQWNVAKRAASFEGMRPPVPIFASTMRSPIRALPAARTMLATAMGMGSVLASTSKATDNPPWPA